MSKDSSSRQHQFFAGVYKFFPAVFITLGSVLLFLAGQFIGILLFSVLLSLFGMSPEQISNSLDKNTLTKFGATLFVASISVGLVFGFLKYTAVNPIKYLKLNKKPTKKNIADTFMTYGLYFLSFIVVSAVGSFLISGLDVDQQQQLGYGVVSGFNLLVVFVTLAILPPIAEEILFRGFLFRSLKETVNIKIATIITSTVFAAAHLEFLGDNPLNWIAAIDTFVLSLFLIWLYLKTDNLWLPIMLHALKNSIAFIVLFVI